MSTGSGGGPVVVLAQACTAANVTVRALRDAGLGVVLVVERPVPSLTLARRRAKRLGARSVAGQVLFRLLAVPLLGRRARRRSAEILRAAALDDREVTADFAVSSVNDDETRRLLPRLDPAVVVLVGTRIVSRATLASVEAPFVNLHTGITPRYRGVHGGYWALVEGRADLVGSTVHFVDAGIDTGSVIAQRRFEVTAADNFASYPALHLAVGVPALVDAVRELALGKGLDPVPPLEGGGDSALRHHPTLWGYLGHRLLHGVK